MTRIRERQSVLRLSFIIRLEGWKILALHTDYQSVSLLRLQLASPFEDRFLWVVDILISYITFSHSLRRVMSKNV